MNDTTETILYLQFQANKNIHYKTMDYTLDLMFTKLIDLMNKHKYEYITIDQITEIRHQFKDFGKIMLKKTIGFDQVD